MEQKDDLAGKQPGLNVVEIDMTAKALKKVAPQLFFDRYKWLPFPFLLLFFAAVAACCAMLFAAANLVSLQHANRIATGAVSAALQHPDLVSLADVPPARDLLTSAAKLVNARLSDALLSKVVLIQLGAAMPLLVMLGLFFYVWMQQKFIAPHRLTLRFDADGLQVQRGDSRISHPWSAVEAVVFQPPPGRLPGFVLVRLQFGYTYVWPDLAFASREQWQYVGHQLSALHLASRQPCAA
ncbi:hypothetical protein [Janthinobacterium fluminis]|uniref:DUF304 domain-containing protein n=1 Tax=Janthinobacterium fluminis TaxID=2987524 RepID=A0ABT5JYX7_9BURK|nr:hypothetical protein [Janthinobacterium fluminis]MDC8757929.1 hypothetical protein [Janthinobacterium fluminis]